MTFIRGFDDKTISCGVGQEVTHLFVALEIHDPRMHESLNISLSNEAAEKLAESLLEIVWGNRLERPR